MAAARPPVTSPSGAGGIGRQVRSDPAYAAFWLVRIGFVVLPIWMGVDKFARVRYQHWPEALARWIVDIAQDLGLTAQTAGGLIARLEGRSACEC